MRTRTALLAVVVSAVSLAGPPVQIDCPAGTQFIEGRGCVAKIATAECPKGTQFDGKKCVALVDTSCPAGMHFVAGTGCVAGGAAEAPAPAAQEKKKKGGTFSGGFTGDRLAATCAGATFEVFGSGRLTGVHALLLVDGTRLGDEVDVDVGQTRTITGKHGAKAVELKVQQGLFGTRYTLLVGGAECKLTK
ncbi:MAG: hypothetical protein ACOZQL_00860 [Myxococcota bacterium]